MSLYINGSKVKDRGSYGLRFNDSNIIKAYFNGSLVYEYSPYDDDTQLYYASPASYSATLKKGVYQIALGAGQCGSWQSGVTPRPPTAWYSTRGGGSFVELVFYNPSDQSIEVSAPNAASAYFNLGGTRMITCNAQTGNSTAGGTYSINTSGLDILQTIKASNGAGGGTGAWSAPAVGSVSNYGNWGSSSNTNGGCRLVFKRLNR